LIYNPGLPMAKLGAINSLALEERYVFPDIYERRLIPLPYSTETASQTHFRWTAFNKDQRTGKIKIEKLVPL